MCCPLNLIKKIQESNDILDVAKFNNAQTSTLILSSLILDFTLFNVKVNLLIPSSQLLCPNSFAPSLP